MTSESHSSALVQIAPSALARLSPGERALLTPDVVERWSSDLAPGDFTPETLSEIVELERRRRAALRTLRSTAELTDTEFRLVRYLQRSEGRTRTYLQIAHHLWGSAERPITASVVRARHGYASPMVTSIQVLIHVIRKKLEVDPLRPQHLATIRGVGYRWYSAPPSLDDGEDYERRTRESIVQREYMQKTLGIVEDERVVELPPEWEPGMPLPGPELPRPRRALGPGAERQP